MARGRPKTPLELTGEDREVLERFARRRTTSQGLTLRSKIVLESATGAANTAVAEKLGCTPQTVGKWRARFLERGVDGLLDEPRPGAPRRISDEQVEQIIVKTLNDTPKDATHWSTRDMAKATGLSQSSVSRIWRAFGLQPHPAETWKLSTDP